MEGSTLDPPSGQANLIGGRASSAMRALARSLLTHPVLAAGWLFSLLASCAATLALPLVVSQAVDSAQLAPSILFVLCAVGAALACTTALRFYCITALGEHAAADLKCALLDHLLRMDGAFYDRNKSGELFSRMTTDVGMVRFAIGGAASIALRCILTGVGAAWMLYLSDPRLAIRAMLVAPFAVLCITIGSRSIRDGAMQHHQALAEAFALARERLAAHSLVRAFGREPDEAMRFAHALTIVATSNRRLAISGAAVQAGTLLLLGCGFVFTLRYGAQLVSSGEMTKGTLVQFGLYVGVLLLACIEASHAQAVLAKAHGAFRKIDEVLRQPAAADETAKAQLRADAPELVFQDVHFCYPGSNEQAGVFGASFRAPAGQMTAFIGASGAGKSTVFALIHRFYETNRGLIRIGAHVLGEAPIASTRALISSVPQRPNIFSTSVSENIRYGNGKASEEQIEHSARLAGAHEFIERMVGRYGAALGAHGQQLSGGQEQRLAIARALASPGPLLLLDEPTSALDAQAELIVLQALRELVPPRTVVVITHRHSVMRAADHIVLFDGGRVVAEGSHEALRGQPLYEAVMRDPSLVAPL